MGKIIFEKGIRKTTTKRHSVIVQDETYLRILQIQAETGLKVEEIVNTLLNSALEEVEIIEKEN